MPQPPFFGNHGRFLLALHSRYPAGGCQVFPATLFDYNGVLVDDEAVHLAAFRDVLEPYGLALTDRDYWQRYLGYDDAGAFRAIFADAGRPLTDAELAELIEAKRPLYLGRAKTALRPFDGAAPLVRRCAEDGPVVVVSGALRSEVEFGLDLLGIADCVAGVVAAEDTSRSKPDPEGYVLGMRVLTDRLGSDAAQRGVAIEDSIAGIQAAKGAGLACVAVCHSYPRPELSAAGADLVVERIATLSAELLSDLYRRLHAA